MPNYREDAGARAGMTKLAAATEVNRVNLYQMLSENGNPGIRNVRAILDALKLRITVVDEGPSLSKGKRPGRRRRVSG